MTTAAEHSDINKAIAFMLGSALLFSACNVIVKYLGETYPVPQIVFFRNFFALVPVVVMMMSSVGLRRGLPTRRPFGHLWRASIGLVAMFCQFWSFTLLPLADAVAIGFSSPLFLTALSIPLLGERVGWHRWTAVALGFIGVLIIVRPGFGGSLLGSAVALGGVIAYSLAMIAVRRLGSSEHTTTIVFYFTLITTVLSAAPLPQVWITPDAAGFAAMAVLGVLAGSAQYCLTRAHGGGPASVVGPFNYSAILWSGLLGWLFWAETPGWGLWVGGAIVIASGIYIVRREAKIKAGKT